MRKHFENPWPHETHGFRDILRWKLGIGEKETARIPDAPDDAAPNVSLDPLHIAVPPAQGWRITWLGHSSFLIQGCGKSLLIDPVFSDHCSPIPIPSLKRKVPAPCCLSDLPAIDAILLTHSHYDHLDLPTLRRLGDSVPLYLPSGHATKMWKHGFKNVAELAWWESGMLPGGIRITSVPSQHFTARTPFDKNLGHWCGWVIECADKSLWHVGDSGYCPAFQQIGERFGGLDFGMIPIGAYQPRSIMKAMHMNPEEAVRAFLDAKCKTAFAMHWGTFRLTDEPMGEPPILLRQAVASAGLPAESFVAGNVGEIRELR